MPVLLSGCAISVTVPATRFDSPEVTGEQWRARSDLAVTGYNEIYLSTDFLYYAPDATNPMIRKSAGLRFDLGLGVHELVDFDFRLPGFFQLKYQLAGPPRSKAQAGDSAMAVTAAVGRQSTSKSGAQPLDSNDLRKASLADTTLDVAMITGYRVFRRMLVYSGAFFTRDLFSGSYTIANKAKSTSSEFSYSGTASTFGANLGIELGPPSLQCKLETAYAFTASGQSSLSALHGGLSVGVRF